MTNFQRSMRAAAVLLLQAGDAKKRWTVEENRGWTRAFNTLQQLAGKKIRLKARAA